MCIRDSSDTLTNFEAGFKSTLADGKIVLNGNLHTMNWDDFQSTSYIYDLLTVAFVQNVGQATISGLELESYFNLSDSFSASLMLFPTAIPNLFGSFTFISILIFTSFQLAVAEEKKFSMLRKCYVISWRTICLENFSLTLP